MPVVGMDAAGPDEADHMQTPTGTSRAGCRQQGGPLEEAPVRDRGIDPRQILEDGPPGAEVEMPDFGVAHLARWQTDGTLGRTEDGMRPPPQEGTPGRHRRGRDGVTPRVAADPEPVEHDEDDRARSVERVLAFERWPRGDVRGVCRAVVRGHAAAPRAAAVRPARATIPAISSAFRDAPPTSAPSIAGSERNSAMLADVTLPP